MKDYFWVWDLEFKKFVILSAAKYLLYGMHREENPSHQRKARIGQNAPLRGIFPQLTTHYSNSLKAC
jgi:hypothetical protein